jgi:transcriptional regulator with XRE-family HTH domain
MDDIGDLATMLRDARHRAYLSQGAMAARSGVPQSSIAAFELRRRLPSLTVLARLLAALDLQPHITFEPRFVDLDALIDAAARATPMQRLLSAWRHWSFPDRLMHRLAGPEGHAVVAGPVAAALQGAPLTADRLDLLVPRDPAVLQALERMFLELLVRDDDLHEVYPGTLVSQADGWAGDPPEYPSAINARQPVSSWDVLGCPTRIRLVPGAVLHDGSGSHHPTGSHEAAAPDAALLDRYSLAYRTAVLLPLSATDGPDAPTIRVAPLWSVESDDPTMVRVLDRMRTRPRQTVDRTAPASSDETAGLHGRQTISTADSAGTR